ncbi:unnamed protein product [Sphenostylis stenocarpa]|uniref:Arf-GAP domain-containing protein n=1 Tax=Sphenostylis stenocarpa TaxID=92480 RepID=A0AA86SCQ5_9FABA|nr:unnamed protein product [Sphenostylis stenocarpa]
MNGKAFVSKELNAKHAKILEGLLKLPENRECADCRNRAPRWASVNLGIFICMQCSGIHRSLGVHISKVRSTTLDTWLPEQISFMQFIGNEKSNKLWEAEMPPNFDRSKLGIDKFIRAKYVEKRWASKDEMQSTSNGGSRNGILKNNRRLSLEESVLANHVAQILPPTTTRARGGFIDMQKKNSPPFKRPSSSVDFDNLLCIYDDNQAFSTVPPSSWATFDCMIIHTYHNVLLSSRHVAPSPPVKRCRLDWRAKAQRVEQMEIRVCSNRTCRRQGSFQTLETLCGVAPPNVTVKSCGCLGRCGSGPNLVVLPDGLTVGHCGTAARAAELMVNLFAEAGHDPKACMDALALRKRADIEFANRNFTQLNFCSHRSFVRLELGNYSGALQDAEEALALAPRYTEVTQILLF